MNSLNHEQLLSPPDSEEAGGRARRSQRRGPASRGLRRPSVSQSAGSAGRLRLLPKLSLTSADITAVRKNS